MLEKKEGLNILFCYEVEVSWKSKVREGGSPIDFITSFS